MVRPLTSAVTKTRFKCEGAAISGLKAAELPEEKAGHNPPYEPLARSV